MPKRSNASRSNQFAHGQISTTLGTTGNASSGAKQRTRSRQLWASDSR